MRLTDAQRKLLVECCKLAAVRLTTCAREHAGANEHTARKFASDAAQARELAALIEGAESVTVGSGRAETLAKLRALEHEDTESAHVEADDALLEYIGDPEIAAAYEAINKWYA